nr:MAG TPA: hypothetical protein [Bacteriophage sp.]
MGYCTIHLLSCTLKSKELYVFVYTNVRNLSDNS